MAAGLSTLAATAPEPSAAGHRAVDILIVGGGLSGMTMAIEARRQGFDDLVILEKGDDFGGTWRENTYPGIACDIPAHLYALATHPNPGWRRRYAAGAEIQAYIRDVAAREGLYGPTRFGRTVTGAQWDAAAGRWEVETAAGERWRTRVLVSALGPLHVPRRPDIPGIDRFRGPTFHSAEWDHGVELTGRRVAVIGTGASAIQLVPEIAGNSARVTVYQRSAPWVAPHFDFAVPGWLRWSYARLPGLRALDRAASFALWESKHAVFRGDTGAARLVERIALWHLRRAVPDLPMRQRLTPDYRIGCKRILLSNRWYPTLMRPDVELVTEAIAEIRPGTVMTTDGAERPADVMIYATGFQVIDTFANLAFRGSGGQTLADNWAGGISTYLGTAVHGFPNLFFLLGPNTALGHNSVVLMAEAQVAHVLRLLSAIRDAGIVAIEPRAERQAAFQAEVTGRVNSMVWKTGGCGSWYRDAEGRIPTLWPGTVREYRRLMRRSGMQDYVPVANE